MASKELQGLARDDGNKTLIEQNDRIIELLSDIKNYKAMQSENDTRYRSYRYQKDAEHSKVSKKTLSYSKLGVFMALAGGFIYLIDYQIKYNWIGSLMKWVGV